MSEDNLAKWKQDEQAVRGKLAGPGLATIEQLSTMSGIDFFSAIADGRLPMAHIGALLGFVGVEFEPGRMVFQGTPDVQHYNPIGTVHGGYAATLLDSCVGCAIHTALPAGTGYTTLELKINYIRAMSAKTGPVRAEGRVVSLGKQVGIAEGRITDSAGKLYATASTTCLVFKF